MSQDYDEAGIWDFEIHQGQTFTRTITLTDSAGSAVDLTNYTIEMDIRSEPGGTALVEASTETGEFTLSDPTAGECTLTLSAATTAALDFTRAMHDVKFTDGSDTVTYYLKGSVRLVKRITV